MAGNLISIYISKIRKNVHFPVQSHQFSFFNLTHTNEWIPNTHVPFFAVSLCSLFGLWTGEQEFLLRCAFQRSSYRVNIKATTNKKPNGVALLKSEINCISGCNFNENVIPWQSVQPERNVPLCIVWLSLCQCNRTWNHFKLAVLFVMYNNIKRCLRTTQIDTTIGDREWKFVQRITTNNKTRMKTLSCDQDTHRNSTFLSYMWPDPLRSILIENVTQCSKKYFVCRFQRSFVSRWTVCWAFWYLNANATLFNVHDIVKSLWANSKPFFLDLIFFVE